jgi:ABC-2 type transport system ATP-binding protein
VPPYCEAERETLPNKDAIEIRALSKDFGDTRAVDDVSFTVRSGDIFGFMGHNGAGKTTTIRILLGLLSPTSGTASIFNHDVIKDSLNVRSICGYLPDGYGLPKELTARQFLRYVGSMFAMSGKTLEGRINELLALFHLTDVADRKLATYSSGMTQKVGLAQALINEPRLLLLDEPTSGLDPIGRQEFLELIRSLSRERGVTTMFSTHILSDIERLCERVAVLHQGKLIASGNLSELKELHGVRQMDELYMSLVQTRQ